MVDSHIDANPTRLATALGADYELREVIGSGGCGKVYKAFRKSLNRLVAIKAIRDTGNSDSLLRLHQEAQILAPLKHKNIVEVFSLERTADGFALVMEYIDGHDLDTEIEQHGPLSSERCRALMTQCAEALQVAHAHNIIHRDIKPANILLCQGQGTEVVKLVDFGLAKHLERTNQKLTKTGALIGTPLYMSPEACRGEKLDGRADIYALGCAIYKALTGKQPIAGSSSLEIMYKHLNEGIPAINHDDEALSKIIAKCTEPLPENRFQSCADLLQALQSNRFAHPTSSQRNSKPLRKGLIAVVAMACCSIGVVCWQTIATRNDSVSIRARRAEKAHLIMRDYIENYTGKGSIPDAEPPLIPAPMANEIEKYNDLWTAEDHRNIGVSYSRHQTRAWLLMAIQHFRNAIRLQHEKNSDPYKEMSALCSTYLKLGRLEDAQTATLDELQWAKEHGPQSVLRYQLRLAAIALIRGEREIYNSTVKDILKSPLSRAEILDRVSTYADPYNTHRISDQLFKRALTIDPEFPFGDPAK